MPSEPIEIVRVDSDRLDLMRGLLACFSEAFADPENYESAPPRDEYLRELLADKTVVVLVALAEGEVAGGLVAYELRKLEQERSEVYIYDLAVAEQHRRKGVATGLIQALKPIARAAGAWVIYVQADGVDAPALALYDSLGTREDDVYHFDIPVA